MSLNLHGKNNGAVISDLMVTAIERKDKQQRSKAAIARMLERLDLRQLLLTKKSTRQGKHYEHDKIVTVAGVAQKGTTQENEDHYGKAIASLMAYFVIHFSVLYTS